MDFKANLKDIRTARGLTQKDLAIKLNVSDRTVSSWESGRTEPNMGMVEEISKVLNCRKSDLIGVGPVDFTVMDEKGQLLSLIEQLDRNTISHLLDYARFISASKNTDNTHSQ